jgi:hypothetical protein
MKKTTAEKPGTISNRELCKATGRTDSWHRQLAKSGYFPSPVKGRYQFLAVLSGLVRYFDERLKKQDSSYIHERTGLVRAKRIQLEKQNSSLAQQTVHVPAFLQEMTADNSFNNHALRRIFGGEVIAKFNRLDPAASNALVPIMEDGMAEYSREFLDRRLVTIARALHLTPAELHEAIALSIK